MKQLDAQDYRPLATDLYAKHLISYQRKKESDLEKILDAVMAKIQEDPLNFHIFIQILQQERVFDGTCRELQLEYKDTSAMTLHLTCEEVEHRADGFAQKLCISLRNQDEWKRHPIRLQLGDTDTNIQDENAVIFVLDYNEPNITIKDISKECNGTIDILVEWCHTERERTLKFYIKKFRLNSWEFADIDLHLEHQLTLPIAHVTGMLQLTRHRLKYTGMLDPMCTNAYCRVVSAKYRGHIMRCNTVESQILTHQLQHDPELPVDVKAYFMCYHSIVLTHANKLRQSKKWLRKALNLLQEHDPDNFLLVSGRARRVMAKAHRTTRNYDEAEDNIKRSTACLENAVPSCEVATTKVEYAVILQNKNGASVDRKEVECLLRHALADIRECKDAERRNYMIPMTEIEMALFHLHAFDRPSSGNAIVRVQPRELQEARQILECEKNFAILYSASMGNTYQIRHNVAKALVHFNEGSYAPAADAMEMAAGMMKKCQGIDEHNLDITRKRKTLMSLNDKTR